ncbi:hypothetical protein RRG08_039206 [Elysia crispata]|uniref:Uncharacterized protein n=1 Tax=Elysia crispata TaxID=231223 RepID=A0AAE1AST5_9GAST|nr:hypothetical protein RRG08_039206 [Elysia crispata]
MCLTHNGRFQVDTSNIIMPPRTRSTQFEGSEAMWFTLVSGIPTLTELFEAVLVTGQSARNRNNSLE